MDEETQVRNPFDEIIDLGLSKLEHGHNDAWLVNTFREPEFVLALLRRVHWENSRRLEALRKTTNLRKHLTYASRANASKRRHLQRLQFALMDKKYQTFRNWVTWAYVLLGFVFGYWWKT